jgi:hypothetical protein
VLFSPPPEENEMTLLDLIEACVDKDLFFDLHYFPEARPSRWRAVRPRPFEETPGWCPCRPDDRGVEGLGDTPREAVEDLLENLKKLSQ